MATGRPERGRFAVRQLAICRAGQECLRLRLNSPSPISVEGPKVVNKSALTLTAGQRSHSPICEVVCYVHQQGAQ